MIFSKGRTVRRKKFKIPTICMNLFLMMLPIGIEQEPDSSRTNLHLSFGHGNYASIVEGCEDYDPRDKAQVTFSEIGLQIDHMISKPFRIGIRGGYIHDPMPVAGSDSTVSRRTIVISPFINVEWRYFAAGVGYIYTNNGFAHPFDHAFEHDEYIYPDVNFFLRLGNLNTFYMSMSLYHTIPAYSSAYFEWGIGVRSHPRVGFWTGLGAGPYNGGIWLSKISYDVNRHFTLNFSAGIGRTEDISQNAVNIGLQLRIP